MTRKFRIVNAMWRISLLLPLMIPLGGCPATTSNCPADPLPDAAVGAEIVPMCFPVVDATHPTPKGCNPPHGAEKRANCCPAFKDWTDRLRIHAAQTNIARGV